MRRLLIALCVLGTLLLAAPGWAVEGGAPPAHVDVINVGGLVDPVQSDFVRRSIHEAETGGATALIIQLNSGGGVVSQSKVDTLAFEISHAAVPVAVWVGPSGKGRAIGSAFAILRAAGIVGVAPGTRIGNAPPPVFGGPNPLAGRTIGSADALRSGFAQIDAPTLVSFVGQLDGKQVGGRTIATDVQVVQGPKGPTQKPQVQVRFAKVGLLASLMHTASSPSVAYLLLVIGLLLMVLEFFTAGIGVAAVVGAGCLVLSAYGLTVLPTRWWAVALLVVAVAGYAIDLQAGAPRFWTGIGTLALVIGTVTLVHGQHLSVLAMVAGVAG
ncbi:MAG: hypothetical protein QOG64_62, partial [Acidimicrobiaceae bacterium]|nr:hypothetical protein [Acidimicrobiaceae bacterium]